MELNFTIDYIFDSLYTHHHPNPTKHRISPTIIKKYFQKKGLPSKLTRDDILSLFNKDHVSFYSDSIRYYDPEQQVFLLMVEDFSIELNQIQKNYTLMLSVRKKVRRSRRQFQILNTRIRNLENQFKKAKEMLFETTQYNTETINVAKSPEPDISNLMFSSSISLKPPLESEFSKIESNLRLPTLSLEMHSRDHRGFPFLNNDHKLDIAIMNAEPLVQVLESRKVLSLPDAVDYEEECREIYDTLRDKQYKILLMFEIATRTNLVNVLSKNPKILHIMCHGEYDSTSDQFYLCFENSNGELDRLFAADLKDILNRFETKVQLVFVNACHSEAVARVFVEAGVPYVIAVQSQLQISDTFAKRFANEFYDYIFDGKSVRDAFKLARAASTDPSCYSCCCAHAHKPGCKWQQRAKREGYHEAHSYHDPICTGCHRKGENIHRMECHWAEEFRSTYAIETEPDFTDFTVSTCCCSPELPHNETLKFVMLSKESNDSIVLFDSPEYGKVQNLKLYNVIDQRFPEKRLVGRNRQLYEIATTLRGPIKVVKIEGPVGTGKTAIARQAANYLYARNHFRHKISMIELRHIRSVAAFLAKLFSEMNELVNDISSFCEAARTREVLFILDEGDTFIENNRVEFSETLRNLTNNTKCVKFLLLMTKSIDLGLQETSFKLGSLHATDAARLLIMCTPLNKISPPQYRNIDYLKKTELFSKYSSEISIQTIWWIHQKFLQGQKFDKIEAELISKFKSSPTNYESKALVESILT